MKKSYTVQYSKNINRETYVPYEIEVEEVGECPCCHIATSPTYINGFMIGSQEENIPLTVYIILYCPRCRNFYLAKYLSYMGVAHLQLNFVFPKNANQKIFSDNINKLSPEFVSIYNQALESETNIATQGLAGLGYRKALEFLIKDYLIKIKYQDKETIIKMDLNDCINKLDKTLQILAKASAWIGNDETHYFRKNPEYNIEDLKDFINSLIVKIESNLIEIKANKLIKS